MSEGNRAGLPSELAVYDVGKYSHEKNPRVVSLQPNLEKIRKLLKIKDSITNSHARVLNAQCLLGPVKQGLRINRDLTTFRVTTAEFLLSLSPMLGRTGGERTEPEPSAPKAVPPGTKSMIRAF